MAVKIRLKRIGMKKRPFYRVVVADEHSPRDGRFIEEIGYYDPMTQPATVKIDPDKARLWLGRGAQPTDTTRILLRKIGALAPDTRFATSQAAKPAAAEA
ncbi:MAG: 30S ribosomal protein S16 [Oscillospiraceae bacterium]|jgi:small subunit ribosomal protein S16|nr:30S ribosomal protein S16 [Oscillospiraceae bacterium]